MSKKKVSLKQLESHLQDLDDFENPKIELEQYATPPHIAAVLLNTIDTCFGDIENKTVADLGCGTGRLLVGSIMLEARLVYGFDIDQGALSVALQNISDKFSDEDNCSNSAYSACNNFNLILANIASGDYDSFWARWGGMFDTVMMNPPFGTKNNQGLDMDFLRRAIQISRDSIYSIHKTSTREYIMGKTRDWGVRSAKPIAKIRYNLDNTYKFHKKKSVDIDVDLWQIKV